MKTRRRCAPPCSCYPQKAAGGGCSNTPSRAKVKLPKQTLDIYLPDRAPTEATEVIVAKINTRPTISLRSRPFLKSFTAGKSQNKIHNGGPFPKKLLLKRALSKIHLPERVPTKAIKTGPKRNPSRHFGCSWPSDPPPCLRYCVVLLSITASPPSLAEIAVKVKIQIGRMMMIDRGEGEEVVWGRFGEQWTTNSDVAPQETPLNIMPVVYWSLWGQSRSVSSDLRWP